MDDNTMNTFTQDDVNNIVGERLAKEKQKLTADIAQREQELAKREFMLTAREKITAKGFDAKLVDALNTSSPEAFDKSLIMLETYIQKMKADSEPNRGFGMARGKRVAASERAAAQDVSVRAAMGLDKR